MKYRSGTDDRQHAAMKEDPDNEAEHLSEEEFHHTTAVADDRGIGTTIDYGVRSSIFTHLHIPSYLA